MLQVTAAILASLLFNVSLVLQSIEARRTSNALSFRFALIAELIPRPVWLAGTLLVVVAYCMEVVALTTLPIGFVQPIIAAGVLLLPPLAHVLGHERLASRVVGGIALIIIGVVALSFDGPRATVAVPATPIGMVIGLTVGCLVLFAVGRWSRRPGVSAAIAGVGYAGTGIITRILASHGDFAAVSLVIPLCAAAIVAFLAETSALQGLPATRVGPVVLALGTALPVICGRLALGERWPDPLLTVASLGCIVLGGAGVLHFVEFGKSQTE